MAARVGQQPARDAAAASLTAVHAVAPTAAAVLAHHGRSFHWASAFLSREHARDAATLYAFCRHADDLVDEQEPAAGAAAIAALRRRVAHQHRGDEAMPGPDDPLHAFAELLRRRRLLPDVIDTLLATLQQDAGPVRLQSRGELLRYAYGVASTVGLLMCDVLDCEDERARAFAIDLGIAMQLTNVARDVLEDARRDRIYLPLAADIGPVDLLDSAQARDRALATVREVLALAATYYRSADRGLCYLPLRARAAILAASRIYEGIGDVIRRRGAAYWDARCHVGTAGKLVHTLRAVAALALRPRYWRSGRGDVHDGALHADLRGLPGVTGT